MSADIIHLHDRRGARPEYDAADAAWSAFVVALLRAQQAPSIANMRVAVAAHDHMMSALDACFGGTERRS